MKKLIPILQELEDVRRRYGLTFSALAGFVGCSPKTIYNWLVYRTSVPSFIWRKTIGETIRKIEREELADLKKKEQDVRQIFRLTWPWLTKAEKVDLLELANIDGTTQAEFLDRMKELAAKHKAGYYEDERLAQLIAESGGDIVLDDYKVDLGQALTLGDVKEFFGPGGDGELKRPEFEEIVKEYEEDRGASVKNKNWLYVEYYGDPARYAELMKALGDADALKSEHEVKGDAFFDIVMKGLATK